MGIFESIKHRKVILNFASFLAQFTQEQKNKKRFIKGEKILYDWRFAVRFAISDISGTTLCRAIKFHICFFPTLLTLHMKF